VWLKKKRRERSPPGFGPDKKLLEKMGQSPAMMKACGLHPKRRSDFGNMTILAEPQIARLL
jgi:hypothetical protein